MNLYEIITSGGGLLILTMTVIQVSPIKVNPWSKIAKSIGRAMNVEVMDKLEESEADVARYRILRFNDEVRYKVRHSEEHFNQLIDDIDKYERYCRSHPEYKNNKALSAIKNIKQVYEKCRRENSFLD